MGENAAKWKCKSVLCLASEYPQKGPEIRWKGCARATTISNLFPWSQWKRSIFARQPNRNSKTSSHTHLLPLFLCTLFSVQNFVHDRCFLKLPYFWPAPTWCRVAFSMTPCLKLHPCKNLDVFDVSLHRLLCTPASGTSSLPSAHSDSKGEYTSVLLRSSVSICAFNSATLPRYIWITIPFFSFFLFTQPIFGSAFVVIVLCCQHTIQWLFSSKFN